MCITTYSFTNDNSKRNKLCGRSPQYAPDPCKLTFDLLTLKVVSESRVIYFCANFSLPRPLCSRLRPNVRDRQTSDAHHRLMPPLYGSGGIINNNKHSDGANVHQGSCNPAPTLMQSEPNHHQNLITSRYSHTLHPCKKFHQNSTTF